MKYFLLLIFLPAFLTSSGQNIGIGTTSPNSSAAVDISSNSKGILIPRLTEAQRNAIVAPAPGLMVFDSSLHAFYYYNGSAWRSFKAAAILEDEDGDSRVQIEKFPDEDILRVDLAGVEKFVLRPNRIEFPNNDSNIFIGYLNGFTNISGMRNTAIGNEALRQNQVGSFNTAVGFETGKLNNSGSWNTALGYRSLHGNLFGSANIAIGSENLFNNISGNDNIAIGTNTLFSNTTGNSNISIGSQSLIANTSGNNNIAIGASSLRFNTTKHNLIAIGDSALLNNGVGASAPSQSVNNVAIGFSSMKANTFGHENTAVGTLSMISNTTGFSNTASGHNSMPSNTTGSWNTGIGKNTLLQNTGGGLNTAIGYEAMSGNTTGNGNTAVGYQSGKDNTIGSNNTMIGYNANVGQSNLTNATAIGYNAVVNTSNALVLGNNVKVGIGTSFPAAALSVKRVAGITEMVTFEGSEFNTVFNADPVTEKAVIRAGKMGGEVVLNPIPSGRIIVGAPGQNSVSEVHGEMQVHGEMFGNGGRINMVPLGVIEFACFEDNDYAGFGNAYGSVENISGNLAISASIFGQSFVTEADNLGCVIRLDPAQIAGYSKIVFSGNHTFNATGTSGNAYLTAKIMRFIPDFDNNGPRIRLEIRVDDFPDIGTCSTSGTIIVYGIK